MRGVRLFPGSTTRQNCPTRSKGRRCIGRSPLFYGDIKRPLDGKSCVEVSEWALLRHGCSIPSSERRSDSTRSMESSASCPARLSESCKRPEAVMPVVLLFLLRFSEPGAGSVYGIGAAGQIELPLLDGGATVHAKSRILFGPSMRSKLWFTVVECGSASAAVASAVSIAGGAAVGDFYRFKRQNTSPCFFTRASSVGAYSRIPLNTRYYLMYQITSHATSRQRLGQTMRIT